MRVFYGTIRGTDGAASSGVATTIYEADGTTALVGGSSGVLFAADGVTHISNPFNSDAGGLIAWATPGAGEYVISMAVSGGPITQRVQLIDIVTLVADLGLVQSDEQTQFTAGYYSKTKKIDPAAGDLTPDLAVSNVYLFNISANISIELPANIGDGQEIIYLFKQTGAGNFGISFAAGYVFTGGPPVISGTTGTVDFYHGIYNAQENKVFGTYQGQGSAGESAAGATSLTADFSMPAIGSTVVVAVGSNAALVANLTVFVLGAGYMQVTAKSGTTAATLLNLGVTGNAAGGSTIASGSLVLPAGPQGPQGVSGAAGVNGVNGTNGVDGAPGANGVNGANAVTPLLSAFSMPAIGATVIANFSTTLVQLGMTLFVATAGYLTVDSVTDATHAILRNTGASGNTAPTISIPPPSPITISGPVAASGRPNIRPVVTTTDALVLTDDQQMVTYTNAAAIAVALPVYALGDGIGKGYSVDWAVLGVGQVTFSKSGSDLLKYTSPTGTGTCVTAGTGAASGVATGTARIIAVDGSNNRTWLVAGALQ